ncbi:MAG TPA: hypothetical protein VNK92_00545 [Vicinamibacterales bacterium]|nr:hypothetical protein [Vicinamibacterales bacterium]
MSVETNPNHHLWRNGRLWWVAFTVVYDGWRQDRIRRSLGTADLEEARRRRDELLAAYAALPNAEVPAFTRRRAASRPVAAPAARPVAVEQAATPA